MAPPAPAPVAAVAPPAPAAAVVPPMFSVATASGSAGWWQYARWVWLISRNSRITEPTGAELAAVRAYLKLIWNPVLQTGTRPWLETSFQKKAVTGTYNCNLDNEPTHVLVELVGVVGRDLDDIPITDVEKGYTDTLIAATGNTRYGTGPKFGGVGGSTVTIP